VLTSLIKDSRIVANYYPNETVKDCFVDKLKLIDHRGRDYGQ